MPFSGFSWSIGWTLSACVMTDFETGNGLCGEVWESNWSKLKCQSEKRASKNLVFSFGESLNIAV